MKKVVFFLRWCAFLLFLATLVAGGIAYRRADSKLCRIVQTELRLKFPHLAISFESVRLDATRGVRIRSVAWRKFGTPENSKPLLAAEEIYVECPIDWKSISAGNFKPRRIVVTRPQLRTSPRLDALVEALSAIRPAPGDSRCPVEIFDAAVLFDDASATIASRENARPFQAVAPSPGSADFDDESDDEIDELDVFGGASAVAGIRVNLTPTPRSTLGDPPKLRASDDGAKKDAPIVSSDDETSDENAPNDDEASKTDAEDEIVWKLDLRVSNPFVKELRVRGFAVGSEWSARGSVDSLDVAPLGAVFSADVDKKNALLRNLRGRTSFDFEAASDDDAPLGVRFRVDGALARGAVATTLLKYPLSDVDVRFSATESSAVVERATARCGSTVLTAAYRQNGPFAAPTTAKFRAKLDNFPLDDAPLKNWARRQINRSGAAAAKLRSFLNFLDHYQFSATTNVDLTLEKTAQTENRWSPTNVVVDGENVSLLCVAFPYRLDALAGRVSLDRAGTLKIDLRSEINERKIKIDGFFESALDKPIGGVAIEGLGCPIDAKLLSALPEASRAEIAKLRPSGTIDADVRISYRPNRSDPLRLKTTIGVRDGALQYDAFPLPISSIGGLIKLENDAWVFSNLSGKSGAARLRASGSLVSGKTIEKFAQTTSSSTAPTAAVSTPERGADFVESPDAPSFSPELAAILSSFSGAPLPPDARRFELTTDVDDFPLGEELQNALVRFDGRDAFEQMRLAGKANGQIRLAYRTDENKIDLEFDAEPVADSASMKPDAFPYELKNLEGRVSYRAGEIQIDGWRARNGATTYSANVRSRFSARDGWTFDLSSFRVDRLQLDRELQSAAPSSTLALLEFFKPTGFFNVDGALRLTRGVGPNAPLRAAWDVRIVAQQNAASPGVPLENVCGRIKLRGAAIENGAVALGGEFDLDSFCWKDLLISNFIGPFYFDGRDFHWGREAPPPRQTILYRDAFLHERIDADPLYRLAISTPIYRAQTPEIDARTDAAIAVDAPGFAAPTTPGSPSPPAPESRPESRPIGGVLPSPGAVAANSDDRRPIQAVVFGGQATTDGVIFGGKIPTYRTTFNLKNARLDDVSREFAPGEKPLPGRVAAFATLNGEGTNVATLKGKGGISVQDAALYELPQIVKIFRSLGVQEPDQAAFDSAVVDFEAFGDRLKLTSVLFEGNALTLFGDGWLTVRENERLLDLTLNSRLGDTKSQIPIVSDLIGGVGDQLAQIRVEGNLSAPIVRQERFPGVKKAWWSVFPNQEPTPTDKTPTKRSRPVLDALKKLASPSDADKNK